MNIAILSCFRDAEGYIERYCEQMDRLRTALDRRGEPLMLVLGYGDSSDDTDALLCERCWQRFDTWLVDVAHGGPKFGSIEHPVRFRQLASIGNKLLEHVPASADVVGIVESDLIWQTETMLGLIDDLANMPRAAVAPMVMDGAHSFYDVFAFRRNGVRFTKQPPYHVDLKGDGEPLQLDSAGSVLVMDAGLARKARFDDGEAIVGFCRDIYRHGGSVWLDTTQAVQHPESF